MSATTRVLYLAATPTDAEEIDLDADYDAIREAVDTAQAHERFEFRRVWGARSKDLLDALNSYRPNVVHFSGHGLRHTGVVLTDESGLAVPATAAGLTGLFRTARYDDLKLIVLMACYSLPLARALAPYTQAAAIGVEDAIDDDTSTDFNRGFYSALASGRNLQAAYEQGNAMVRMRPGTHPRNRPELAPRAGADVATVLVPPPPSPAPARDEAVVRGLRLLDVRLHAEAAEQFREALRSGTNPEPHYYLAYTMLRGRRPAHIVSLDEARAIESHLVAAVQLGTADGQIQAAHPFYLWAWLKLDYYKRHGLLNGAPPSVSELLRDAARMSHVPREIDRLLALAPRGEPDDVVVAALRARQVE